MTALSGSMRRTEGDHYGNAPARATALLCYTASMFRRLQIAESVFFALVAAALCVLWARSYWWFDSLEIDLTPAGWTIETFPGELQFDKQPYRSRFFWNYRRDEVVVVTHAGGGSGLFDFYANGDLDNWVIGTPYWLPTLTCSLLAALIARPSFAKRFSVRSMLVATTVIAIALGAIVALSR
jgi:hypothetical protein